MNHFFNLFLVVGFYLFLRIHMMFYYEIIDDFEIVLDYNYCYITKVAAIYKYYD